MSINKLLAHPLLCKTRLEILFTVRPQCVSFSVSIETNVFNYKALVWIKKWKVIR